MLSRRSAFLGLICSPAIVRASSLMPIKSLLQAPVYVHYDPVPFTFAEWVEMHSRMMRKCANATAARIMYDQNF